jgi:hypothetical protein
VPKFVVYAQALDGQPKLVCETITAPDKVQLRKLRSRLGCNSLEFPSKPSLTVYRIRDGKAQEVRLGKGKIEPKQEGQNELELEGVGSRVGAAASELGLSQRIHPGGCLPVSISSEGDDIPVGTDLESLPSSEPPKNEIKHGEDDPGSATARLIFKTSIIIAGGDRVKHREFEIKPQKEFDLRADGGYIEVLPSSQPPKNEIKHGG